MMRRFIAIWIAGALALPLPSGQRVPKTEEIVFRAATNLVIVNVNVRDKDGRVIEGLKKEDFHVFEDGKPQSISVFEFQQLDNTKLPAISVPETDSPPAKPAAPQVEAPPPAAGEVRYKDKRLMVLFFDFTSMPAADQVRTQDAAIKFLETRMTASDLVALMTFSQQLRMVEEFTSDRETLIRTIRKFPTGEGSELAGEAETPAAEEDESEVLFTADDSEFNIFNTDRKLSALETAARQLGIYPEKKALIYFSSGVGKTGVENHSQLRATTNAAQRANVSIYAVDARGLMAMAPAGDASKASPRGKNLFSGQEMSRQRQRFQDQQETLYTLAGDTGGKALLDSNDLTLAMAQAQRDIRSYYILGYYSSNTTPDGRFRRIEVKTAGPLQAKLDYRPGYYAPKEWKHFTSSDKERQLEEAMQLGNPATELALALEVNYFRFEKGNYFVPVAVKIPGSEITLARKGSSETAELDFIGQVRDEKNRLAGTVRDAIRVRLTEANAALLARRHLQYDTGFQLSPGSYRLKFLARENASGKMGTFETRFTVPDLAARNDEVRLSSVVWSSQREPLSAQAGAAQKQKKLEARHPLIQDGFKLAPSVTRVFRNDQRLYVYFEVYDAAKEAETASVTASMALYRGRRKTFESRPVRMSRERAGRPNTLAFQFQAPLEPLRPGEYTCQITVIDEIGRKFSFVRAPIVVQSESKIAKPSAP
jgi:VWFA-related protein